MKKFCTSIVTNFKKKMTVPCCKGINQECIIDYDNTVTNIDSYCNIFCLPGRVLCISNAEKKIIPPKLRGGFSGPQGKVITGVM